MSQSDLNRAVAHATGETVDLVSRRGFDLLAPLPEEPDPEDLILDWDLTQRERNVALFRQIERRSIA